MTTIAWDGRSIAADRMYCVGNTPFPGPVPKIRKLVFRGKPAVMGTSGSVEYGTKMMDWLCDGAPPNSPPELSPDNDESCSVLLATLDTVFLFSNSLTGVPIGKRVWACGSGADYALGAMLAGASAKRAVEIASELDFSTGCGLDVLRLRGA